MRNIVGTRRILEGALDGACFFVRACCRHMGSELVGACKPHRIQFSEIQYGREEIWNVCWVGLVFPRACQWIMQNELTGACFLFGPSPPQTILWISRQARGEEAKPHPDHFLHFLNKHEEKPCKPQPTHVLYFLAGPWERVLKVPRARLQSNGFKTKHLDIDLKLVGVGIQSRA